MSGASERHGAGQGLRVAGGLATLVVGAIHLQQYADFIKDVPTIGTLFLLNSFAAGLICVLLATRARGIAALAGVGLSVGALVSLGIARYASGGLFDYVEPTFRGPVLFSIAAEVIAVLCLGAYLVAHARRAPEGGLRTAAPVGPRTAR